MADQDPGRLLIWPTVPQGDVARGSKIRGSFRQLTANGTKTRFPTREGDDHERCLVGSSIDSLQIGRHLLAGLGQFDLDAVDFLLDGFDVDFFLPLECTAGATQEAVDLLIEFAVESADALGVGDLPLRCPHSPNRRKTTKNAGTNNNENTVAAIMPPTTALPTA